MLHANLIFQIGEWLTTTQSGVADVGYGAWGTGSGTPDLMIETPYLGLFNVFPTEITNAGTEYTDAGVYARLAISGAGYWEWSDTTWYEANTVSNSLVNQNVINFAARGDAGDLAVAGWGVWDALTGGTWMYGGAVSSATVTQGDTPRFAAGALVLNFS